MTEGQVWRIFGRCAVRRAALLRHLGDDPYQLKGTVTAIKADIRLRTMIMGMFTLMIMTLLMITLMITLQKLYLKGQSGSNAQNHNVWRSATDRIQLEYVAEKLQVVYMRKQTGFGWQLRSVLIRPHKPLSIKMD